MKYKATLSVRLPDGGSLSAGDVVGDGDIAAGTLASMLRLRQLVPLDEFDSVATSPPDVASVDNEPPSAADSDKPAQGSPDWLARSIADLGLSAQVVASLQKAKLATVGDVLEFGAKRKLSSLEGITLQHAKKLREVIEATKNQP